MQKKRPEGRYVIDGHETGHLTERLSGFIVLPHLVVHQHSNNKAANDNDPIQYVFHCLCLTANRMP